MANIASIIYTLVACAVTVAAAAAATTVKTTDLGFSSVNKPVYQTVRLYLNNMQLTLLDSKIFNNATNVILINCNHNHIQFIHPLAFDGIKLRTLLLRDNKLAYVPKDAFDKQNKTLLYLDLGQNKLFFLDSATFINLINLHTLYLDNNDLQLLGENVFPKQLKVLNVKYNPCTTNDNFSTCIQQYKEDSSNYLQIWQPCEIIFYRGYIILMGIAYLLCFGFFCYFYISKLQEKLFRRASNDDKTFAEVPQTDIETQCTNL